MEWYGTFEISFKILTQKNIIQARFANWLGSYDSQNSILKLILSAADQLHLSLRRDYH